MHLLFAISVITIALLPATGNQQQRKTTEQNKEIQQLTPVTVNVVQNPPPSPQQQKSAEEKPHNWYEWFWPPIWSNWGLIAVAGIAAYAAFNNLGELAKQSVSTEKAANAASDNALAVISAERAWIFADLLPSIGNARFIGEGKTHIYARINCRNVGRSPAWITEIRSRFFFVKADELPLEPALEDAEQVWAGTNPIAPTDEAFSTGDYTFTAEGIQGIDTVTGEWAVVYGVVRYRDIYQTRRQTTFGYRLMPGTDVRFTRLIDYPKYNESS